MATIPRGRSCEIEVKEFSEERVLEEMLYTKIRDADKDGVIPSTDFMMLQRHGLS